MPDPTPVSLWVALGAGLLSFFSPCVLPMVPVYLLYMTGTAAGASGTGRRPGSLAHAVLFVVGFGLIFTLGGVTAGYLGSVMPRAMGYVVRVGGVLLILSGLHAMGLVSIPFLSMERRLDLGVARGPAHWRSFVVGLVFAAGWTPCVGPVLTSIFSLAAVSQTAATGAALLAAYSAGLGVPFLVVAALSEVAAPALRRLGRHGGALSVASGAFLLVMGFLLLTGHWQALTLWLNSLSGA